MQIEHTSFIIIMIAEAQYTYNITNSKCTILSNKYIGLFGSFQLSVKFLNVH